MYVYHVAADPARDWTFTEEVTLNGKSLGGLAARSGARGALCEYQVQTVPAGPLRVVARPWLAVASEDGSTESVSLDHVAEAGARYFVRLKSGPRDAPASGAETNGHAFSGAHTLELFAAATPPADIAACGRPRAPDAPSYDQVVLDQILPCMNGMADAAATARFAAAVCGCWSRHAGAAGDLLTFTLSVGAAGRVDAVRAEPDGALATCLERDVPATDLPAPPAGAREVTIRLRPGA